MNIFQVQEGDDDNQVLIVQRNKVNNSDSHSRLDAGPSFTKSNYRNINSQRESIPVEGLLMHVLLEYDSQSADYYTIMGR